jgi:hypothetical protein
VVVAVVLDPKSVFRSAVLNKQTLLVRDFGLTGAMETRSPEADTARVVVAVFEVLATAAGTTPCNRIESGAPVEYVAVEFAVLLNNDPTATAVVFFAVRVVELITPRTPNISWLSPDVVGAINDVSFNLSSGGVVHWVSFGSDAGVT